MMKKRFIYYVCMLAIIMACSDDFTQKPAIGALSDEALQNAALYLERATE